MAGGLPGLRALAAEADAVVVVDVLSFSTACAVAAEAGAEVVPWNPDTPPPAPTEALLVVGDAAPPPGRCRQPR